MSLKRAQLSLVVTTAFFALSSPWVAEAEAAQGRPRDRIPDWRRGRQEKSTGQTGRQTPPVPGVRLRVLTEDGGHLAWHHGKGLIAFDRMGRDGYFDLWLMNEDGGGQRCLTCDVDGLPKRHVGQPAWHPSGNYLALQAQKAHVPKSTDNRAVPGAGALNDLYVMRLDGSRVWKVREISDKVSKSSQGILHPHFLHDGTMLLWTERIRDNGKPFGEWQLKLADFDFEGGAP